MRKLLVNIGKNSKKAFLNQLDTIHENWKLGDTLGGYHRSY